MLGEPSSSCGRMLVSTLSLQSNRKTLSTKTKAVESNYMTSVNDKDDALKKLPIGAVDFAIVTLILAVLWLVAATHLTDALSPDRTWNVD